MPKLSLYDRIFFLLNKNSVKGKDRLYSVFHYFGFKKLVTAKIKYGVYFNLNPYEYIDSLALKEGFYESEVTDEIIKNLSANDTFWDIGANIGLHSLAVKKMLPQVEVVSFEPNPITLSLLISNAELNDLKIQLCAFPLYDKRQLISLHVVDGNLGMSTLHPGDEAKFKHVVNCQTVTGNDLIAEGFKIPAVIKIDTEGSEIEALKGCDNFLGDKLCKAIIMEAGNDLLNEELNELKVFLHSFGFTKINKLERKENSHHDLSNFIFYK
jgi:FkbM family methyltransferase